MEWVRWAGAGGAAHAEELARALGARAAAHARLAAALRADLAARRPYAAYLASCRAARAHADHALNKYVSLHMQTTSSSCPVPCACVYYFVQENNYGHVKK